MATPRQSASIVDVPHGLRLWLPVIGLAVLLTTLDAGQTYIGAIGQGRTITFPRAFLLSLTLWWTLAALARPVLWLSRQYRLDGDHRWRNVLIHMVAGVLFALTHLFAAGLLRTALGIGASQGFTFMMWRLVEWLFAADFFIYWTILGARYTLHYYQTAKEREIAAAQLRSSLTEARLQTLRAQLNPHFLFNALNAISVLAMRGEPKIVVSTVAHLGELLRVSLDDSLPQEVPLSRELEVLGGYLDIQRVRFLERLAIEQDIASDALDALVPSLILQPLVENAIVHGISPRAEGGTVAIRARQCDGALQLSVSDTGPGFQPAHATVRRRGIGLASTEERLAQLYGRAHRIEYGASEIGGALVRLTIPLAREGDARPVNGF